MNHERFERLILSDRPLTPAEAEALHAHAGECRACAELQARWLQAEAALTSGSMLAPRPGFTDRWAGRRAAQSIRREARQAWRLFGGATLSAMLLAALLGWLTWQGLGSIPAVLAGILEQGLRLWLWARVAGEVTQALAVTLPIPVTAGVFFAAALLVAGLGLTSALVSAGIIRFSFQGARK